MGKLHELLAVNSNLDGQVNKVVTDLTGVFTGKRHLFEEKTVTFQPLQEGAPAVPESRSDIQTTVAKELGLAFATVAKGIDLGYQIDTANTTAVADIVTEDGDVLLKGAPATFLLQLEKRLAAVTNLIGAIPTLDPAKAFSADTNKGPGIYIAREVLKNRTKKVKKVLQAAPATDKHPAQVAVYDDDEVIGTIREQEWSSMVTPATKAALLDRCEILQRAVKKARSRANDTEATQVGNKIGGTLLAWITKPLTA